MTAATALPPSTRWSWMVVLCGRATPTYSPCLGWNRTGITAWRCAPGKMWASWISPRRRRPLSWTPPGTVWWRTARPTTRPSCRRRCPPALRAAPFMCRRAPTAPRACFYSPTPRCIWKRAVPCWAAPTASATPFCPVCSPAMTRCMRPIWPAGRATRWTALRRCSTSFTARTSPSPARASWTPTPRMATGT